MGAFKNVAEVLHNIVDKILWHDDAERQDAHSVIRKESGEEDETPEPTETGLAAGQVTAEQVSNQRSGGSRASGKRAGGTDD